MKKQKSKFVLATASLSDINKQLKINLFSIIVLAFLLGLNMLYLFEEKKFFSAALILLLIFFLYFMAKSREILKLKKQELEAQHKAIDKL